MKERKAGSIKEINDHNKLLNSFFIIPLGAIFKKSNGGCRFIAPVISYF